MKRHIARVDILRGIAILCVFFYHAQICLFPGYQDAPNTTVRNIILNILPSAYGWTGVHLFLIISGFLIHLGFMSQKQTLNIITFYSKRFWRIYPPYLLVLLILCITGAGVKYYLYSTIGLHDLLAHLFFLHNLSNNYIFTINGSFWSLALEMQLYLIYPVFLLMRKFWGINKTMIFLFVLVIISGIITFKYFSQSKIAPYYIISYWFTWCAGAMLAERYWQGQRIFGRYSLPIAVIGFIIICSSNAVPFLKFTGQLCVFVWAAFFEWMLYAKININTGLNKTIAIIGVVSYSIYLIHQPLLYFMLPWFNFLGPKAYWAFIKPIPLLVLIFVISYFTHKFIELPSIQLGYYFRKKINPKTYFQAEKII